MSESAFVVAVVQQNPMVGDIIDNITRIREAYLEANGEGASLVVCPELSVTGHPLADFANIPDFLTTAAAGLDALAAATRNRRAALIVGAPVRRDGAVHNAARVLRDGKTAHEVLKRNVTNLSLFDERRNFAAGADFPEPFDLDGRRLGLLIGGDAWTPDAARHLAGKGASALICLNASPYHPGVTRIREESIARARTYETGLPFLYVNCVGGQDDIVFDGGSFLLDGKGRRVFQLPRWEECAGQADLFAASEPMEPESPPEPIENLWRAIMLGLGDYVRKSGFTDVVLGLSGGLDSALVAALAGDALGPEKVHCVRLPSPHTAGLSNDAAADMCRIWGFGMDTVPIAPLVAAAEAGLASLAPGGLGKLTRENMQARARGYILMAISNERGWLLLATGNKSEIATGYSTLYGDMCGGYSPLKDVYKTTAYALARWRNRNRPAGFLGPAGAVIPEEILDRPPTAELSPGQKDTDSLPPYEVLDAILERLVENEDPIEEIIAQGFEPELVEQVYSMLMRAEYKRRQAPPGPKTTRRAFARDRHMPIVTHFQPDSIAELWKMAAGEG